MNETESTRPEEARELLGAHPFVEGLSQAQLEALVPCAKVARFGGRALVFREGEPADALYLLVGGRVVLEQQIPGGPSVQVESLAGGEMLGLSWLFPNARWTLRARAIEPTVAVVLDARCVHRRMEEDAVLGVAVAKHVIEQLYQRLERVRLQRLDVYRSDR